MDVIFSERALQQLGKLEGYLAERFYPRNAERFVRRLTEACRSIGLAPYQGTRKDQSSQGIRSKGFEHTVTIYFDVSGDRVRILCVMYRGKVPRKMDLKFKEPRP